MRGLARRLRRLSVVALVIAGAIGWGVAITSPAATADASCTVNSHCFGLALGPESGIKGDSVDIAPSCLSVPSGNFVTDELWLSQPGTNTYWVEVGFMQNGGNLNVGGIVRAGRYGFWGDRRPGSGGVDHVLQTNPPPVNTAVRIQRNTSTSFWAYFGRHAGLSTDNRMTPTEGQWGSETSSGAAHSLFAGSIARYLTRTGWHSGIPHARTPRPGPPETFRWTVKYSAYRAGVSCK